LFSHLKTHFIKHIKKLKLKIMHIRTLIYFFIYAIFAISCNKSVIDSGTLTPNTNELKAATIGTTYYVAKTGNDNNYGTSASPFLTIQKAANVAKPGDCVIVGDGNYTNSSGDYLVQITTTGTTDQRIVFKSMNKYGAVLDGNSILGYGIRIGAGASYITIQDFTIKNFLLCGIISNEYPKVSSNIKIEGNKIFDIGRAETTTAYGRCAIYLTRGSSYWNITRNLMYNIGRTGPDNIWLNKDHAVYSGATTDRSIAPHHINVTYNVIYGCSGHALSMASDNDLYANNVIAWTKESHYGGGGSVGCGFLTTDDGVINTTIINNVFYQPSNNSNGQPWAIGSFGHYVGHVIKNNVVYGGRLFEPEEYAQYPAEHVAARQGNNYGKTDCEHPEVNPLFGSAVKTNILSEDFSLQASSPLINAGIDVGLKIDFLGNPIVGLPDIGAYEATTSNPTPNIFYNTQISASVTKNSCGTGYTGSVVTYTVAACKYSSTVSQADADSKATTDVNANKQTYANTNGTCTAIATTVYYNTAKSATATKNDCGTGYTGSTVTETVPAKYFSSTISQADADNKAIAKAKNEIQAYANANGTCTAIAKTVYYNTAKSATATKNDCGTGYTGSTITGTVPAKYFSSTISQADADNKAIIMARDGIQAYANANGTCTAK
jgi:hypothetical protein